MKALCKLFVLLLASIGLASCGGGGGGSNSSLEPVSIHVAVSASPSPITTNSFTTVTVKATQQDGAPVADGAGVNLSLSPASIGTVSSADGTPCVPGNQCTSTSSGGQASFFFNSSNQTGTAHLVASVTIVLTGDIKGTFTDSGFTDVTVTGGGGQDPRLKLVATATTLPQDPFIGAAQVAPFPGNFIGSPYVSEVTLTWRHSNGELVAGTLPVNVSIDPVGVAVFSQLDDPTTQWTGLQNNPIDATGNEFLTLLGSGPVNVTGGNGVIFVHSTDTPGTATLTVTALDPDSGQTFSSQMQFTVAAAGPNTPSSVVTFPNNPVYIASSGGPQSTIINAIVYDTNDALVPDPGTYDNVEFEIVGPAGSDARLSGINASGTSVTGTKVDTVTHNGIAAVTFQAGAQQGPVQVRATADRGDGNVDDGIQDAVSSTTSIVVSDGRLFSLTLTSPVSNGVLVNDISNQVTLISQNGNPPPIFPPDPDGTYSLTVSAVGTDRYQNPVVPGTSIRFGSVDAPTDPAGTTFDIAGTHGDPQEGGSLFTATDGHFVTAGGGSGPGDTLLVIGKDYQGAPDGNVDLESAMKIASVQNDTNLHIVSLFNWNDYTGTSVNNGPVLPYIIGRAQIGTIGSPGLTNTIGVATTTLNYPVSQLGRITAVYAQGDGTNTETHPGSTDIVTDVALTKFPGVGPATIVVSPNPIPGNTTVPVQACLYDALGAPISGATLQFTFSGLGVGSGTLDGINGAGNVPDPTSTDGCVTTTVFTTGIVSAGGTGGGGPELTFSAIGATPTSAPITGGGALVLIARPTQLGGTGGPVVLTLLNSNGTPVPGVQLTALCTNASLTSGPGVTDSQGQTSATITADLNTVGTTPGTGSCTFAVPGGTPSVIVNLQGVDICTLPISPLPSGCSGSGSTFNVTVLLNSNTPAGAGGYGGVSSVPAGVACSMTAANSPASCTGTFTSGTSVTLTASGVPATATSVQWGGSCNTAGTALSATFVVTNNVSCTLKFFP
jgi:hypothetical protein